MKQSPSPLQACFLLTEQEKRYILVVCALFLLGLAVRYFYLKNETLKVYTPAEVEQRDQGYE
ncbi:MAG TPA: hypothetical protein VIR63_06405 [Pontiella sp.]